MHRQTRRKEAADTAVSGEGLRQAGKLLYCVEGGLCFQQASHSLSQTSTSVDREPQKDRGRDWEVETAAEGAHWSEPEGVGGDRSREGGRVWCIWWEGKGLFWGRMASLKQMGFGRRPAEGATGVAETVR